MVLRTTRVALLLLLLPCLLVGAGCSKLGRHRKGGPDAAASASPVGAGTAGAHAAAPLQSAALTPASAALAPASAPTPQAPPPEPPPVDPNAMPAADRAAFEKASKALAEVQTLLANSKGKNAAKPAESDLKSKCEEVDAVRARLEGRSEPEVKTFLETGRRVCSFDVPVFTATNALDQMHFSASQASRGLMCKVAEKDIARARKEKPHDARVRALETRWHSTCR